MPVTAQLSTERLIYWITEREAIRCKKEACADWPWTDDPILRDWRFCNVRREDDKVTRWIVLEWLAQHISDPDLWFAAVVARFVNWPDTLAELGWPVPWNPRRFLDVMTAREARSDPRYGGAYKIPAGGLKTGGRPTPVRQVEDVFGPLWAARERLRPTTGTTLAGYLARLQPFPDMGSGFMPARVIGDLKFVSDPLAAAPDWSDFAVWGPGSRRGLNRVLGRPVDAPWTEQEWRAGFDDVREAIQPDLARIGLGDLDGQSFQSCLCEFDKWERVRLGEGTPRQEYRSPRSRPDRAPLTNSLTLSNTAASSRNTSELRSTTLNAWGPGGKSKAEPPPPRHI